MYDINDPEGFRQQLEPYLPTSWHDSAVMIVMALALLLIFNLIARYLKEFIDRR